MVYSLTYRRPAYVQNASSSSSLNSEGSTRAESLSSGSSCPYGIPEALSFDKIIGGGTCPPCTTRDFMNFLIYIEHSAENLQFYLWYRDYVQRFSKLPESEKALAPQWSAEQADQEAQMPLLSAKKITPAVAEAFKNTDFDPKAKPNVNELGGNPFNTPPRTPVAERESMDPRPSFGFSDDASTLKSDHRSHNKSSAAAFEKAHYLQPFTIQPFREEISRVIATYLANGGSRQLNLSDRERQALLHALANTTHPSAFKNVVHTVEWSLRHQAHPNFIRWTICNGNRPRVIFARGLGVGGIVGGIICAIVLTLSSAGRGWRALSAIALLIGISTLIAAWKGMCVVLHGMHHRHLRPWELFVDEDEASADFELKKNSFDSVGSNNSYEDEPWVAKYEKRNIVRKVFDREVWIQEPALRQIQDTIFLQALGGSIILSAIITAVFVALPKGNYF